MKGTIRDFLLHCETVDFGKGVLSKRETAFYRRFSKEILFFCRSLPKSTQTDSILFLLQYAGIIPGNKLDFFAHYYPPAWSIIYWLSRDRALPTKRLEKKDVAHAVTAQSLAMFLHSLDDHLTDKQLSVSPLTLLLRSQAWTLMNRAFRNLAEGLPEGMKTVRGFIDDYYESTRDSKGQISLVGYGHRFRKQMAIGMVAPILLSLKMTGFSDLTRDVERAYGSFGIAWRLLDDIRDIKRDLEKGKHSAIYIGLPDKMRTHWNHYRSRGRARAKDSLKAILKHILENNLIDKIKEKIGTELETAASRVEAHRMIGLAKEFRDLNNLTPKGEASKKESEPSGRIQ